MTIKRYKYLAGIFACLLLALVFAVGTYAENELPWVPLPTDQKPTSIKLASQPIKQLYLVGEELDVSGAQLELTYESGQTLSDVVKTEWCTGFDSSTVGTKTVTITYPETSCTATFEVEVVTETEIKIVKPEKLVYFVGDSEELSGLTVSVVYSNGSSSLLESGYTVTGFSSNTVGEKTVTVNYKDLSASYVINVVEPALLSIRIDKKPNKLSYYIGETLDITGIKVTAVYENGVTADVSSKVTVSGDVSSSGVKTITVEYFERDYIKKTEFEVTVTDVQIKNIQFASYPNKTVYAEHEAFDQTGISIKVTYNNGEVKTVSEDFLFTGFDTDTIGKKTITLHYGGYQLNFEVEVVVSSTHVHKESEFTLTKAPACREDGEETTTCLICFEIVSRRTVPATGHGKESMPVQTKAPTCTEAGQTSTYCMVCGEAVTVSDIFPLGHTTGEPQVVIAPTCTEGGVSKTFCTACSAVVTETPLEALGHTFGEWTVTLEPTGEHDGSEQRSCIVCTFVESHSMPKLENVIISGDFSAQINTKDSYFPYLSQLFGEKITDNLTNEELDALMESIDREKYAIIDVFEFAFAHANGESFLPEGEITYTVKYNLPATEYASFLIYDADLGRYTPVCNAEEFSFTVERAGRFLLVGEQIPEPTGTEQDTGSDNTSDGITAESSPSEGTDNVQATVPPVKGTSAIIMVLIIIAVILIVIIALLVYTYIFKQYY